MPCAIMPRVQGGIRAMTRPRTTLLTTAVLILFVIGISVAWVQDVQVGRALVGQVTDEQTQQPVPGATIRTSQNQATRETQSDDAGRYRIGIGAGPLTLTVQARGYQTTI